MFRGSRLATLGVAAALALVLLIACRQITLHGWYAPHAGYRAQVDALLSGRLALATTPDALIHDLAWTPSGVQQVWGLGVPLWQLPFEALGRLVGWSPFPDRLALAAWLAAMLFAVLRGFRDDSRWVHAGSVLVTALLPAFVTLLRCRLGAYEEAAIYSYGAALILLGGTLALLRKPTAARYLVLVAAAGLTGLIRPTVWFYGLATLIIASVIVARGRRALPVIALGVALFVAGGGALYATNAARFGRGTEFGHRLNLHSLPGNIVATRFSYPFERAGLAEAATELAGSLFDRPELRWKKHFYETGLHAGQSPLPRWREYYFTTFSWPYVPLLVAGIVLGALAWRRRGDRISRVLGAWAALGGTPLAIFYLHSPSVASRYQLDLAPAFAAVLVIAWRAVATRWPRRAFGVLVALWAAAIVTSKTTRPKTVGDPIDRAAAADATYAISRATPYDHPLPAGYDLADPLVAVYLEGEPAFARCTDETGAAIACDAEPLPGDVAYRGDWSERRWWVDITRVDEPAPVCATVCEPDPRIGGELERTLYLNGFGWNLATGAVPPATLFYMTDPERIELDVDGPPDTDWSQAVRVAVGLEHPALAGIADLAHGVRLSYAVHEPHPGLEVAFVAFGPDTELDRPVSRFTLRAIRWR